MALKYLGFKKILFRDLTAGPLPDRGNNIFAGVTVAGVRQTDFVVGILAHHALAAAGKGDGFTVVPNVQDAGFTQTPLLHPSQSIIGKDRIITAHERNIAQTGKIGVLAPSSSGPGRRAFIAKIMGSIPIGVTKFCS